MWLLNIHSRKLEYFEGDDVPAYAILSHRWQDDEVTFKDMQEGTAQRKMGYRKIDMFCRRVSKHRNCFDIHNKCEAAYSHPTSLSFVWVDTCCIDKTSSAELSEAINSMYKWYQRAAICFAYLADVSHDDMQEFRRSLWFTRGWTLQELLAPHTVVFFSRHWDIIGNKSSLRDILHQVTRIPLQALDSFTPKSWRVAQVMLWAARRSTAREEDKAYSLLGLFHVNMPLIYGEGKRAFQRLQEEILRTSTDLSIFAHGSMPALLPLADSPAAFDHEESLPTAWFPWVASLPMHWRNSVGSKLAINKPELVAVSDAGISITLYLVPWCPPAWYFVPLFSVDLRGKPIVKGMIVEGNPQMDVFNKLVTATGHCFSIDPSKWSQTAASGQFRRIVLQGPDPFYEHTDIPYPLEANGVRDYHIEIRRISLGKVAATDVYLFSRIQSGGCANRFSMLTGTVGVAGMVRVDFPEFKTVFFLFGYDFDFNFFCLTVQIDRQHLGQDDGPEKIKFSVPSLTMADLRISSDSDMLKLLAALRPKLRNEKTLPHGPVQLYCILRCGGTGENSFGIPNVGTLFLRHAKEVRESRGTIATINLAGPMVELFEQPIEEPVTWNRQVLADVLDDWDDRTSTTAQRR